jgi:DNA-binding MarR family transcriptional regulator
MTHPGPELALLLLASYRRLVDDAVLELERRGHPDVTPTLHYAMTAIDLGAATASELGQALAVTKQAAAKTVTALVARDYVEVAVDPDDSRRKLLRVTELGHRVMRDGEEVFDVLRDQWIAAAGQQDVTDLERVLRAFLGGESVRLEAPGWPRDH